MPTDTTVGVDSGTKERLDKTRDGLGFPNHAKTIRWLLDEVGK